MVIIPAFNAVSIFKNDVLRKIGKKILLQYCLENAERLGSSKERIFVLSDNEEVLLFSGRYGVQAKKCGFTGTKWEPEKLLFYSLNEGINIFLSPYAPKIDIEDIIHCKKIISEQINLVIPVKKEKDIWIESGAFFIFNFFRQNLDRLPEKLLIPLKSAIVEIRNYTDWWICEKILQRKRIIFYIAAYKEIGMGHLYRALSLAHELISHEIIFVYDERSELVNTELSGYAYPAYLIKQERIADGLINLNPDIIINDILDTEKSYILKLKEKGIKVLNFEDSGEGAKFTDITINDLYDEPFFGEKNILWGSSYFFLRDEFLNAAPKAFSEKVHTVLLTFGGTDQNDFTRTFFKIIYPLCLENDIFIYIVTGRGYLHIESLQKELNAVSYKNVQYIHTTGIMSSIMEKTDIAISSNGRTSYELAHMHIPAIVVSHHKREASHSFTSEGNGFINLGLYEKGKTDKELESSFRRLISDTQYRKKMYDKMTNKDFNRNKSTVVDIINNMLTGNQTI